MNWFYESAGQQQGPVPEQELDRLLAEGKITQDTLVWREGLGDWQPLRTARVTSTPPEVPPGELPPGNVRCTLTGKVIPESEAIYIQGKPYSAEAKPQVLHSLQSGGTLPSASDADRTGPAWEDRATLGYVQAAWLTIKQVLMEPSATFSKMKREGGLGAPLAFYMIVGTIGAAFFQVCLYVVMISGVVPTDNPVLAAQAAGTVNGLLIQIIFIPVQIAFTAFLQAGIMQVSLMICGAAKQPYEATFRTLCYSGGAVSALFAIPVCGWIASPIWGIVTQCIGLARVQEITTGKAVLAVFLPMIVCCGLLILAGLGIAALIGSSGGLPTPS